MRSTIIPAQIMTVEDTLIGSITFSQVILGVIPILLTGVVYTLVSSEVFFTTIVLGSVGFSYVVCWCSSIRIRGRLLYQWGALVLSFLLRPKQFVFRKDSTLYRNQEAWCRKFSIIDRKQFSKVYNHNKRERGV